MLTERQNDVREGTLNSDSRNLTIGINNTNLCSKLAHALQRCMCSDQKGKAKKAAPTGDTATESDLVHRWLALTGARPCTSLNAYMPVRFVRCVQAVCESSLASVGFAR